MGGWVAVGWWALARRQWRAAAPQEGRPRVPARAQLGREALLPLGLALVSDLKRAERLAPQLREQLVGELALVHRWLERADRLVSPLGEVLVDSILGRRVGQRTARRVPLPVRLRHARIVLSNEPPLSLLVVAFVLRRLLHHPVIQLGLEPLLLLLLQPRLLLPLEPLLLEPLLLRDLRQTLLLRQPLELRLLLRLLLLFALRRLRGAWARAEGGWVRGGVAEPRELVLSAARNHLLDATFSQPWGWKLQRTYAGES